MKNLVVIILIILAPSVFASSLEDEYQKLFGSENVLTQKLYSRSDAFDPENGVGILLQGTTSEFEIASNLIGLTPPLSWPKASVNCKTVLCAIAQQYQSDEIAMRVMIMAKRYGIHISLDQHENNIKYIRQPDIIWTLKEVNTIEEVYEDIPDTLRKIPHFKYFYRLNGKMGTNGNVPAEATPMAYGGHIVLADGTFEIKSKSDANLEIVKDSYVWTKLTILHEMCHQYDSYGNFDYEKNEILSIQKDYGFYQYSWVNIEVDYANNNYVLKDQEYCLLKNLKTGVIACEHEKDYIAPKLSNSGNFQFKTYSHRLGHLYNEGHDLVTWYANSRVQEDFAESCSHYRYAPKAMKNIRTLPPLQIPVFGGYKYSNRYEFMKHEIFEGIEY